jgi:hypothetical protein
VKDECPLNGTGANDILHDSRLLDPVTKRAIVPFPIQVSALQGLSESNRKYVMGEYGPEPLFPQELIGDINNAAKDLIDRVINEITAKAGVGGPTITRFPK